nr:hypothetical protein [Arthrobacter sp. efr-133-TYG-104]
MNHTLVTHHFGSLEGLLTANMSGPFSVPCRRPVWPVSRTSMKDSLTRS